MPAASGGQTGERRGQRWHTALGLGLLLLLAFFMLAGTVFGRILRDEPRPPRGDAANRPALS
jgi:hypothetical protein